MKYILLSICLLTGTFMPLNHNNNNIEEMWKEVYALESKGLPQSALEIVEKIKTKAIDEKAYGHLIQSIIYAQKLIAQFEDKDPADYIDAFESSLSDITHPETRAILQSFVGELYHQYGMMNLNRMQERTELDENKNSIAFLSLDEIQRRSIQYYLSSLDIRSTTPISDYEQLWDNLNLELKITADNIEEFLVFRALSHFINDRSVVTQPKDRFEISDPNLMAPVNVFKNLIVQSSDQSSYKLLAIQLFQRAILLTESKPETNTLINLKRLEYINRHLSHSDKTDLYLNALESIIKQQPTNPSVELAYAKLIDHFLRRGELYRNEFNVDYAEAYQTAYAWIQKAKQAFSDGKYEDLIRNQKLRLNSKHLNITLESVVPSKKDFLSYVEYRNTKQVYFRLYQIQAKDWEEYLTLRTIESKLDFLNNKTISRQWRKDLQGSEDFNYHATELDIEALDYGRYILMSSVYPSFKYLNGNHLDLNTFSVSDLSYIHNSMESVTEGYVLNRISGKPCKNVEIDVYSQQYNYNLRRNQYIKIADINTDKKGYFFFDAPEKSFNLVIKNGDDILDTRQGHYNRSAKEWRKSNQVHLFTDRRIYRPGQLVYLKGLVNLINDNNVPEILEDQKVTVTLKDVNWQDVESKIFTSNQYGTFNGYFTLPEGLLNGGMQIEARTTNGYGSITIKVEEYKRPKINLEFLPIEEPYALGDTVSLSGLVQSFSGVESTNSKVKYQVVQESYWPWWRRGFTYRPNPINRVIADGEIFTGEDGQFKVRFPTSKESDSYYNYTLVCDVTDVTGETVTKSKSISLSESAIKLNQIDIENGFVGTINDYSITVVDAENNPVEVPVKVTVSSLEYGDNIYQERLWRACDILTLKEEDYKQRFPGHKYNSENDLKGLKVKSVVSDQIYTSSKDTIKLSTLKEGVYKIEFELTDTKGRKQNVTQYLQISPKKKAALATQNIWVGCRKLNFAPGEKATVYINAPYKDYNVFFRTGHNRKTLEKAWLNQKTKSFDIDVTEEMYGGIGIEVLIIKDNRLYRKELSLEVPWSNKALQVRYESFRDKLKPGEETQFALTFEWPGSIKREVEVLASMYDASLDAFVNHGWKKDFYPNYRFNGIWNGAGFRTLAGRMYFERIYGSYRTGIQGFEPRLNKFGFSLSPGMNNDGMVMMASEAPVRKSAVSENALESDADEEIQAPRTTEPAVPEDDVSAEGSVRENLNETVFFYPELKSKEGRVAIPFKMNEALTTWKFQVFAHNEDLQYVFDSKEVITQKELMIEPLMPRYLRQGDSITLSAKVSNLTDAELQVSTEMLLQDALDNTTINEKFNVEAFNQMITIAAGSSELVEWSLKVPEDYNSLLAVTCKAVSEKHSDGERNLLPVLTNRKLITEAMPFFIDSKKQDQFTFSAIEKAALSNTLKHVDLTLEVTTDPRWLVLKSLPVIMDVKHNASDNWMDAYYALSLAEDLISTNNKIHKVLSQWKGDDLISELEKKKIFKELSLDATPWVKAALEESRNMQSLKLLLEKNTVDSKKKAYALQIKNAQTSNGGFSWFPGGRDNWYITQYIMEVVGRLNDLELDYPKEIEVQSAIHYLDQRVLEYYEDISKDEFRIPGQQIIHYLFVRSLFPEIMVPNNVYPALKYFKDGLKDRWTELNSHNQALLGEAYRRWSESEVAEEIYASLQERVVRNEALGYYWNDQAGYYVFNNNIEAHSHMIEFFEHMDGQGTDTDMLRLWLLRHKQVNAWSTNRSTAAAVHVFMRTLSEGGLSSIPVEVVLPSRGEEIVFDGGATASGYDKKQFSNPDDLNTYKDWEINNKNDHPAWGAVYWQYTEQLDKVQKMSDNPLSIQKSLFKVVQDKNGEKLVALKDGESFQQGDKIRTRITLQCDRPMSYIHLSDMRASGTEPLFALSQYQYQDGLSYYQSIKDEATHFYFDNIAKGNYVFEYEVVAIQKGQYSNGIATIQSFYAPEFGSHSEGEQISIN